MKKIHYIFLLLSTTAICQVKLPIDSITNKVIYRKVIELDTTYNATKIYSIAKEWFSTSTKKFNRGNSDKNGDTGDLFLGIQRSNSVLIDQLYKNDQPLKLQDPEEKKIIGKGVLKYTGSSMGCIRILYFEFDIKVQVKDYKVKIEISNFNFTHYNQMSMKQVQIYAWKDEGPCNSKNTIESLLQCEKCKGEFEKLYTFLDSDMRKITEDFKQYLISNKVDENKW